MAPTRDDDFENDGAYADDTSEDFHWLCLCGHYEESGLHCSVCKREPPWGCDCSFCNEQEDEEEENFFENDETDHRN